MTSNPPRPKVLLLAGGLGTRLAGVVNDVPKPMAPIAGLPFLEYQIKYLKAQGFTRYCLLIGHMGEVIRSHFRDGSHLGLEIDYSVEKELLGTGGALRLALEKVAAETNDQQWLVLNGDTLFATDYVHLVSSADREVTLALKFSSELDRYGQVDVDSDFLVTEFREKSQKPNLTQGFINAGAYVVQRSLLAKLPTGKFSFETDYLQRQPPGTFRGVRCEGRFVDIGTPESWKWAQEHLPQWLKDQS